MPPREVSNGRLAVIDVGSNSVRMVVYPATALAAPPLFNEKAMCGLGRLQDPGSRMSDAAMDRTLRIILRFAHLADAMDVSLIDAVATAAIREAVNGEAFIDQIKRETGISVRILTGQEEARLVARGVLAANPGARGLVADLGGGSLELIQLDPAECDGVGQRISLPLGTLRLAARSDLEGDDLDRHIDEVLGTVKWMSEFKDGLLYIVGGAWRSLGRLEIARIRYPIRVLHGYALYADRVNDMCRLFAGLSLESLSRIEVAPRDRLDTLAPAARVLGRLLRYSGAVKVVFSAHGLREGILFEHLSIADQEIDPLLASSRWTALATARDTENGLGHGHGDGEKLTGWLAPLFSGESGQDNRLRFAAGLLSDIGWRIHTDERPDHAMADVMRAPLIGLDHKERVKLALAVRFRYTHRLDSPWIKPFERLIEEGDHMWSRQVGQALRLAHTLSGGMMNLLGDYRLSMDAGNIRLHLGPDKEDLIGESTVKRLTALARSFDRSYDIVSGASP